MSSKRAYNRIARKEARETRRESRRAKQQQRTQNSYDNRGFTNSNLVSIDSYKKDKAWSRPDFKPLRPNHHKLIEAIRTYPIVIINGPAGCLKTYLSLETSLNMIKEGIYDYLIYARQDIDRPNEKSRGSLPGDETEKFSELLMPIEDNLRAIVPPGEMKYILNNVISGSRIDVIRGRSPLNTIILADESQNMDYNALRCIMTRAPSNSMTILVGDYDGQRDIMSESFNAFRDVCHEFNRSIYKDICVVNLFEDDILRNDLNKTVIKGFNNIDARRLKEL